VQHDHTPTPSLKASLLYTLHSNGLVPGVIADRNRFNEVFKSKYGKVRIYKIMSVSKESKEWVAQNRVCDAPGSWFCPGQYPPALKKIIEEKRDFAQLEDFNRGSSDQEYTKEYFENLNKKGSSGDAQPNAQPKRTRPERLSDEKIEMINEHLENDPTTTILWEMISQNRAKEIWDYIIANPEAPHKRSEDGRGPMWWAHEYGHPRIIELLRNLGVSETRKDLNGITPLDISKKES
jgi:dolichyl-diphosphooligosaccharide---protein glycosyltransferase